MSGTKNIAPMKLEVLVAVVHDGKADFYASIIQSHRANIRLTTPAQGTTHFVLNYLGLVERPKTMIVSVVREDQSKKLMSTLEELFARGKDYKGVAFTIPMSSIIGTVSYGFLADDKRTIKEEQ